MEPRGARREAPEHPASVAIPFTNRERHPLRRDGGHRNEISPKTGLERDPHPRDASHVGWDNTPTYRACQEGIATYCSMRVFTLQMRPGPRKALCKSSGPFSGPLGWRL
jgi:hypothetical protein